MLSLGALRCPAVALQNGLSRLSEAAAQRVVTPEHAGRKSVGQHHVTLVRL